MPKIKTSHEVKDCCSEAIEKADSNPGTNIALCFNCESQWRKNADFWYFYGEIKPCTDEEELGRCGAT